MGLTSQISCKCREDASRYCARGQSRTRRGRVVRRTYAPSRPSPWSSRGTCPSSSIHQWLHTDQSQLDTRTSPLTLEIQLKRSQWSLVLLQHRQRTSIQVRMMRRTNHEHPLAAITHQCSSRKRREGDEHVLNVYASVRPSRRRSRVRVPRMSTLTISLVLEMSGWTHGAMIALQPEMGRSAPPKTGSCASTAASQPVSSASSLDPVYLISVCAAAERRGYGREEVYHEPA